MSKDKKMVSRRHREDPNLLKYVKDQVNKVFERLPFEDEPMTPESEYDSVKKREVVKKSEPIQ